MGSEVDRLAAELKRLPAEEWERLAALQTIYQNRDATGQKNQIDSDATATVDAGETAEISSGDQT